MSWSQDRILSIWKTKSNSYNYVKLVMPIFWLLILVLTFVEDFLHIYIAFVPSISVVHIQ